MGYYTRVLSKHADVPDFEELAAALLTDAIGASLSLEDSDDGVWTSLLLSTPDGAPIAYVERSAVVDDEDGADEIDEFLDELEDCRPVDGAAWVADYLRSVKVVYAFQHLDGADDDEGFEALQALRAHIFDRTAGILQADGEGFTNEDGYQVVWQFADDVEGSWWMALLQNGEWVTFQMELGDPDHRAAFQEGRVPSGACVGKA